MDAKNVYVVSISWDDANGTEFYIDSVYSNVADAQKRMKHIYDAELSDFQLRNEKNIDMAKYDIRDRYAFMYMKSINFDEIRIEINERNLN